MTSANVIARTFVSNTYQNTYTADQTFGSSINVAPSQSTSDKKIAFGYLLAIPEALAIGTEAIAWLWPIAVRTVGVAGAGAIFAYLRNQFLGRPQTESLTYSQANQNAQILTEAKKDPNFQKMSPKIRNAIEDSTVMQASSGGKRANNRERGKQREINASTGAPPPQKPNKNKKPERKKTQNTDSKVEQSSTQTTKPSKQMGDWRINEKGVKVYVGPEVPAPQRPTTIPNSTRINNPEPPAKWEIVNKVKQRVEPNTSAKQNTSTQPQTLERQFWTVIDNLKTLVP
jgi:hypothetical protein